MSPIGQAVEVWANHPNPTHHMALQAENGEQLGFIMCDSDGQPLKLAIARSSLDTVSLKISEGNPKYSDFQFPFTPVSQDDWTGGRGQEAFESDVTRYLDVGFIDTTRGGKFFLSGMDHLTVMPFAFRRQAFYRPGRQQDGTLVSLTWQPLLGIRRFLAVEFPRDTAWTAAIQSIIFRRVGSPGNLTVVLCDDDVGADPGTERRTNTITAASIDDILAVEKDLDLSSAYALPTTNVWIKVYGAATDDDDNHWEVGVDAVPATSTTRQSANGTTWAACSRQLFFRLRDADVKRRIVLYEYRACAYALVIPEDGTGSKLYLNGDRGVADDNTGQLTKLVDASKTWITNQWKGCVAVVLEGPGSDELDNWRLITANDATSLTVSPAWSTVHTTATVYAILGADSWREITGHSWTTPVKYLLVHGDVVLFGMGNGTFIKWHREFVNAGAWEESTANCWRDDAGAASKADVLGRVFDATDGLRIWRADDSVAQVSVSALPAWGSNLAFGTGIDAGEKHDRFTGFQQYVDPSTEEKIPWFLKEGAVFAIKNGKADQLLADQLRALRNRKNGRASIVFDTYLFWSFLNGMERFVEGIVEDVGPTIGRGMPIGRQGPLVATAAYAGKFFTALDGGDSQVSSILINTGSKNWHECYRSPDVGQRITGCLVQVIPGPHPDRLWFSEGSDLKWLPLPSETTDPTQDAGFPFRYEGHLVTSRISVGMRDLFKLFDAYKVVADGLAENERWIEVDFKLDDETSPWTTIPDRFDVSPDIERALSALSAQVGKWIMFRVRINTANMATTPVVTGLLLSGVVRTPLRFGYNPTLRLVDGEKDLHDQPDEVPKAIDKLSQLDAWANSLTILTLRHIDPAYDNKRVFLEGAAHRPYISREKTAEHGYIVTQPMVQISQPLLEEGVVE